MRAVCRDARKFLRKHNLDWADFKKNGIDSDVLLAIDDQREMIERVVATARRRVERENG